MGSLAFVICVAAYAALTSACSSNSPLPGTFLGRYSVRGQLQANSCGRTLGAPDPWAFHIELSRKADTLYWSWMDGTAPATGTLDAASHTTVAYTESANLDPADAGGSPSTCTMQRQDTVDLTLSSGSMPSGFQGTLTNTFAATPGSDCTAQLASAGGMYASLPCTVTYALTATR